MMQAELRGVHATVPGAKGMMLPYINNYLAGGMFCLGEASPAECGMFVGLTGITPFCGTKLCFWCESESQAGSRWLPQLWCCLQSGRATIAATCVNAHGRVDAVPFNWPAGSGLSLAVFWEMPSCLVGCD